jgi:class 3 adenylate cyclase
MGSEVGLARAIVSRIPDARLASLDGASPVAFADDSDSVLRAIDEFLSESEEASPSVELPEGMAVLLFADIAESTALTEQLGDAAFRAKARELDTSLRSVIRESGGTPVEGKVLGDGVLAVFTSARQAIDCALRCEAAGQPLGLQLHLGIHAGDVIREGNNVYGGAVNIAARIAAASQPGEVLVSDVLRGLARTSAGVTFDDRGEHELKGVGEPQRLFAVRGGG